MENGTDKQQSCEFNVDATPEEQNSNSGLIVKIIAEVQRQKNTSNQNSEPTTTEPQTNETGATDSENRSGNTRENVPEDITPISDNREKNNSVVPEKKSEVPEIEQPKNIDEEIKPENQPNKKVDNRSITDLLIKPINLIKNEIQKLSKEFIKTFEREKKQFDIQEKILLSVGKIEKGLETDRLAQKEAEKEQEDNKIYNVRIVDGLPSAGKKDEEGGFLSTLFKGLTTGISSLLGLLPSLGTLGKLLSGIPALLGSLVSGLFSFIGVLANPVFLTLTAIAGGIAAIVYELKLAGEMIAETNKLKKDSERLSGQIHEQAKTGQAAMQAKADKELAETGSVSKVTQANLNESEYLVTHSKIEEINAKLKNMSEYTQRKTGPGEFKREKNKEYEKLENEKKELEKKRDEEYKKTKESKELSKKTYYKSSENNQQNLLGTGESLLQALTGIQPQSELQTSLNRPTFVESPNKPLSISESIKESYQNVFFDPVSDSIKNIRGGTFGANPNLNISPVSSPVSSNIEIIKDTNQGLQAGASNALTTYTGLTEEQNRQMQANANEFYMKSAAAGPIVQNIDQSSTVYDTSAPYYRQIDPNIRNRT